MEFDHELRLWLKSKKSSTSTLAWKAGQRRAVEIARGVDVINTGQSAVTILTGCNYAGHCPK